MWCVSHTGYFAHENSEGEARGGNRHKNKSRRVVRDLEEKNVGTKKESPKQVLTCDEDLTIILFESLDPLSLSLSIPYIRLM